MTRCLGLPVWMIRVVFLRLGQGFAKVGWSVPKAWQGSNRKETTTRNDDFSWISKFDKSIMQLINGRINYCDGEHIHTLWLVWRLGGLPICSSPYFIYHPRDVPYLSRREKGERKGSQDQSRPITKENKSNHWNMEISTAIATLTIHSFSTCKRTYIVAWAWSVPSFRVRCQPNRTFKLWRIL